MKTGAIATRPLVASPDQAEGLRRLNPRLARVVALTSGKGGVGKTSLSVNLGLAAARLGLKVIVLDVDLGLANVGILVDLQPRYHLAHLVSGEADIFDLLVDVDVPGPGGMRVVPGASGVADLADLEPAEQRLLIEAFERLERHADVILVDTGAGIGRNVIGFAAAAHQAQVIATPEPTSITDAYAIIKLLARQQPRPEIGVIVNMARHRLEAQRIADRLCEVSERFLGLCPRRTGYVVQDPCVGASVRQRRPLLTAYPDAPAAACLQGMALRLFGDLLPPRAGRGPSAAAAIGRVGQAPDLSPGPAGVSFFRRLGLALAGL